MSLTLRLLLTIALLAAIAPALVGAQGSDFKVGTVDVNRAMNVSDAGQRSRKVLLASKSQKENDLKAKEGEFKKLVDDLRANIMLTEAARTQREQELRAKEVELRQQVQEAQRDLQEQERKLTDSILTELKAIIAIVSQERKLDIVLEARAAETILFSRLKFTDITDEVVARYNKIQTNKP